VNYGSHALLERNLVGLALELPGTAVVVMDNPTTTAEREAVTALCEQAGFLLTCPDVNVGFGAGVNAGVRRAMAAGTDTFLLLNPDAVIHADAVCKLVDQVTADPYLLVSPLIERPDGSVWFAGTDLYLATGIARSRLRRHQHPRGEVEPWLSGCCLAVTAELWSHVGGFADGYFMYWEDVDLSHRVVRAGGRLLVETGAVAVTRSAAPRVPPTPARNRGPTTSTTPATACCSPRGTWPVGQCCGGPSGPYRPGGRS